MSTGGNQKPSTRRISDRALWIIGIGLLVIALAVFVYLGYHFRWRWTGFPQKRLFDWIQILVIPVAVAVGTFVLNRAAKRRDDEAQKEQRDREQATEKERAEEASLQSYVDYMSRMLTDLDKPLRRSHVGDNLSAVAQAQTLTILGRLEDGERKSSVLQFLHEAGLINRTDPVVNLQGADLRGAHLGAADPVVNLEEAVYGLADIRIAEIQAADLRGADLQGAYNLMQDQIEQPIGDEYTTLPEGIDRPKSWSARTDE
jgi:uncharacterized membrane protein